ncbi:IS3 family transposase [Pseudogemmobacter sp. W21_MBD1_M6]|uniref:IS3 family transposase n=1 Tax=Pseudogemmobacter sp. W21_MBD1_M6 TaxID=3240271 RepID=UPI003F949F2C
MSRRARARRTCGLWRSSIARQAICETNLPRGNQQFLETPWYGSRQMARHMKRNNHACGRHRVRRLMRLMRLVPIDQEPNTGKKHPQHKIWPYLLRNVAIDRPNQVWCADITLSN